MLTRRENGSQKGITGREFGSQNHLPDGNLVIKYPYRTRIRLSNIITGHKFDCQYPSIWKGLGGSGRTLKAQGGTNRVLEGLGGSGRVSEGTIGSRRVWRSGRVLEDPGGSKTVWEGPEGSGRIREGP